MGVVASHLVGQPKLHPLDAPLAVYQPILLIESCAWLVRFDRQDKSGPADAALPTLGMWPNWRGSMLLARVIMIVASRTLLPSKAALAAR